MSSAIIFWCFGVIMLLGIPGRQQSTALKSQLLMASYRKMSPCSSLGAFEMCLSMTFMGPRVLLHSLRSLPVLVKLTSKIRIFPPICIISHPPGPTKLNLMVMMSQKGGPLLIAYTLIKMHISSVLTLKLGENMSELCSYQHNYV
jgi:hypothetical protein